MKLHIFRCNWIIPFLLLWYTFCEDIKYNIYFFMDGYKNLWKANIVLEILGKKKDYFLMRCWEKFFLFLQNNGIKGCEWVLVTFLSYIKYIYMKKGHLNIFKICPKTLSFVVLVIVGLGRTHNLQGVIKENWEVLSFLFVVL